MSERERPDNLFVETVLELVNPATLPPDQRDEYMDRYTAAMRDEYGNLRTYEGLDVLNGLGLGIGARIRVEGERAVVGGHGNADSASVYVLAHDGKWKNWSSRHPETDTQGVDRLEIGGVSFTLGPHLLLPGKLDS